MRPAALAKIVARHGALAVGTLRGAARGFVKDGGPRILSYHGVCADPPDEWSVTPTQLRAQMDVLRREFQPVSLQAVVDWLRGGPPLPPRAVAVTFDDGFRDVLTDAAPILRDAGVPGAAFLPSSLLSGGAPDPSFAPSRPFLTPAEARALRQAGFTLGSHARTHPRLRLLSEDQARAELRGSRADLEDLLGEPVTLLAYPYGTNQTVSPRDLRLAAEAGYEAAFLNMIGPLQAGQTDLLAIPRAKVLGSDSLAVFRGSLTGALDLWRLIESR